MDTLSLLISFALIYYWVFPQALGRLACDVKTGYAKRLAEVLGALERQIEEGKPHG